MCVQMLEPPAPREMETGRLLGFSGNLIERGREEGRREREIQREMETERDMR